MTEKYFRQNILFISTLWLCFQDQLISFPLYVPVFISTLLPYFKTSWSNFHFMALLAFQLNLLSLKTSWSNFQEHNSAEDQIPCYSKSFQKLQSVVENGIHHCLEKIPHTNFLPWNWHTTTRLGLSNKSGEINSQYSGF